MKSIILVVMGLLAVVVIVRITDFFSEFIRHRRYLRMELHRSANREEAFYWRRELRCQMLCLIPFVSPGIAYWIHDKLFYFPRYGSTRE